MNQSILHNNILQSMDNGVITFDTTGRITTFNRAASNILNIPVNEAMNRLNPEVFYFDEKNDPFNDILISVIAGHKALLYTEVSFYRRDGSKVFLGVTSSLLKDESDCTIGGVLVFSDLTQRKKARFLEETLSRYTSRQVVDIILQDPEKIMLDGEERDATLLFSDIRGFTSLSESLAPKELVAFLRSYFSAMVNAVFKYNGTLDKFIGDALMCIFGAPADHADHPEMAVRTGLEMLSRLQTFNQSHGKRIQQLNIGIGINTGPVVVGNIGSEQRLEYTAIGDTVNAASRLEGANKYFGTQLLVAESTFKHCREAFAARMVGDIVMKGKAHPTPVYEIQSVAGEQTDKQASLAGIFERGLKHYRQRNWDRARALFRNALEIAPHDGPSKIYMERCGSYLENPPPDGWTPPIVMTSK